MVPAEGELAEKINAAGDPVVAAAAQLCAGGPWANRVAHVNASGPPNCLPRELSLPALFSTQSCTSSAV